MMGLRRFSVGLVFVVVGVLLLCSVAVGKEVHVYVSSFGSGGSGSGEFNEPRGVAVNDVTHDVFVVDRGNNRVQEFNSTGTAVICEIKGTKTETFLKPTGVAVDNSGDPGLDPSDEDVYVVDSGHGVIDKFNSNCEPQPPLTGADTPAVTKGGKSGGLFEPEAGLVLPRAIKGVAVDENGDVWVSTQGGPIYQFNNELANKYVSERETVFGGAQEGLGVDSEDNLYINVGGGEVAKVNSAGMVLSSPFCGDGEAFGVVVDPVGGEVYLDSRESIEACSLGGESIESFGASHLTFSKGVAVDASDGMVYVSDESLDDVAVFEGVILPDVSVGLVSGQGPREVTLHGSVDPEGSEVSSCVFEYGTSSAYGLSVPCEPGAGSLGVGSSPVPVSARLSGLAPEMTYHYRLVAGNKGGLNPSVDHTFFTGPLMGGESVVDVTSSSVVLRVPFDSNGADTHYYFEYGSTEGYGSYAPLSPPGADGGAGVEEHDVSVLVQGLSAGSVFHYRFVAVQDGEVFSEADHVFVTQASGVGAGLPDGRAWELVSPADKKGALIELSEQGGQIQAAGDGSGVTYVAQGPHVGENPAGKVLFSQVLSRRGSGGWGSVDLTLPGRIPENEEPAEVIFGSTFEYHLFSPDLSLAAVEPQKVGTPLLSPEATERTLYLRDNATNEFLPLVTPADVPPGRMIEEPNFNGVQPTEWEMHFLTATPDLAHVVFRSPKALTPEAIQEETVQNHASNANTQSNLYEWGAGELGLVNILPNNEVAYGRNPQVPLIRLAGVTDASGLPRGNVQRAVSDDGRFVAWTWGEPYSPQELVHYKGLFVRDMVEGKTERVGGASASFQTMSSDGSKIFYLENGDLFVFDFATETSTDLTGSGAGVEESVSDVSSDGAYVYFVAKGVLASGGVTGEDNLYLLHDSEGHWSTTFIAALSVEDKPDWYAEIFGAPYLAHITSRVSPNGGFLAFMSDRSLTGYDNRDAVSGVLDEEVYLYDASTGRLACASCDPTGAAPSGVFDGRESELLVDREGVWTSKGSIPSDPQFDHWLGGSVPGWDNLSNDFATYQPRFLSDDGRLFFDSPVGLVAQDTNGLEDVYEFEPVTGSGEGSFTCTESSSTFSVLLGGCIGLISSGTSSSESAFYDASEDGDDVFFITTSKLVSEDYDKGYDVYDAHVCSSSAPCVTGPVSSPVCSSSDSCKAAPTPQPEIFGPAPSATFNGVGNVALPPTAVKSRSLTNAQKLSRALQLCAKKRGKKRRTCERQARKRYPVGKHARKSTAVIRGRGR